MPPLARDVPALIPLAALALEILARGLVRCVCRAECDVLKERPVGPDREAVAREQQRMINEILAEVVALFGALRRLNVMVVVDELGAELVGLAVEESVEAIEAATERPLVERSGRRRLFHLHEVPLARAERGIAVQS